MIVRSFKNCSTKNFFFQIELLDSTPSLIDLWTATRKVIGAWFETETSSLNFLALFWWFSRSAFNYPDWNLTPDNLDLEKKYPCLSTLTIWTTTWRIWMRRWVHPFENRLVHFKKNFNFLDLITAFINNLCGIINIHPLDWFSAPFAWSPWRLMTWTFTRAPAAIKSADFVGIGSGLMRTDYVPPAGKLTLRIRQTSSPYPMKSKIVPRNIIPLNLINQFINQSVY